MEDYPQTLGIHVFIGIPPGHPLDHLVIEYRGAHTNVSRKTYILSLVRDVPCLTLGAMLDGQERDENRHPTCGSPEWAHLS